MKFQTKILLAYMVIAIVAISAITIFFYGFNSRQFREVAYANLENTAIIMSQQIDYQISYMDYTLENLMSSIDFMNSIRVRGNLDPDHMSESDMQQAIKANEIIGSSIWQDSLNRHFYRVNYFNRNYDFFTSRFNNRDTVNKGSEEVFAKMPWLFKVDEAEPKRYISPIHNDQWLKTGKNMVFSILRNIRSFNIDAGYLEVQMEQSKLIEMLNINGNEQMGVILVTPGNEILFYYLPDGRDPDLYLHYSEGSYENEVVSEQNVRSKEIIVSCLCPYSSIKVLLIQNQSILLAPFAKIGEMTLLISLLSLFMTFVSIYLWSIQLTKPIRTLRHEMKRIELSDLTENATHIKPSEDSYFGKDDIKALNSTFYNLFNRLSISIRNEIKARELQMQANADFLQAQINPHFLYNVLNVISNRGLIAGDELICEICACIADMLRYSTSAQSRMATIAAEIAHVENYLTLMQMRHEHRLMYSIEVDRDMLEFKVPKIVLQPFVENSFTHGYQQGNHKIKISITGKKMDSGWALEIRDNGDGFGEHALEHIQSILRSVDENLEAGMMGNMQLSLGGMGIAGTYARLKMFLPSVNFSIGNNPDLGAFVRIIVSE